MITNRKPALEMLTQKNVVDVREYPEFAAGFIHGSKLIPLSDLVAKSSGISRTEPVLLICRSGQRAAQAAQKLSALGFTDIEVLEGGILAWQSAGLPLETLSKKPWSLERQVRAIAGGLVVVFVTLGFTVSHWLFLGAGLIGAGLVFAGVTDICMMATLLGKMPWNRTTSAASRPTV